MHYNMAPVTVKHTELSDFEDRLKTFAPRIVGVFYEPSTSEWYVTDWKQQSRTNETDHSFLFARHIKDVVYVGVQRPTETQGTQGTVAGEVTAIFPGVTRMSGGTRTFDDMLRRIKKKLRTRRVPYGY